MGAVTASIVGAGLASGIGAIASGNAAAKGAQAQVDAANRNAAAFGAIQIPSIQDQQLILQNPALMGNYTPQQQQAMQQNVSEMSTVTSDPMAVQQQQNALNEVSDVAKGGLTQGDLAASRDIQNQVSQNAQARQKAILNQMASRGTLGSGMELAAQLQGQQQDINQQGNASNQLLQQAQARALQAMTQQGTMASNLRSQSFNEAASKAQAQDAINKFNTQNQQAVSSANVNANNAAQQQNLQQKQLLENQRAATANQQQQYNKGLIQTNYNNQLNKAAGQAGLNMQAANATASKDNAQAGQIAGVAGAVGNALGSVANYNQNKENNDFSDF